MALVHSSYIKTTTAVDTRAQEQISIPFGARTQALTIYLRFIELGLTSMGTQPTILCLGTPSTVTGDNLIVYWNGPTGHYAASFRNGLGQVDVDAPGSAPSVWQRVELLVQLATTGAVRIDQSINDGPATTSGFSGVRQPRGSWNAATILFVAGGWWAVRDAHILRDFVSLERCRQRAGVA